MKRLISLTIAAIIISAALAVTAEAQKSASQLMQAHIPFTFVVGDKTLPAGVYRVTILNPSSDRTTLQIRSANGQTSAFIQTTGVKGDAADDSKLVFRRYGERYFFAQAHMAGEPTSLVATKTRAERATERALKRTGDLTVTVSVAKH